MIQCFKNKRPVYISLSLIDSHARKFHISSKYFARSISHRNQCSSDEEKLIENESHAFPPENINVNYLGIESDEGVITVSPKISCLHEKTSTKQLKEKFYKTSYGVIRYDTDNKLKFHGQYGKRIDFVFPHDSNDIYEVSQNVREMTSFNGLSSESNKSSSINATKKSKLPDKKISTEILKENSLKDSGKENHIDQFYFEAISKDIEEKMPFATVSSTDDLNYFDKKYFGHCTETENINLSQEVSEDLNFKDKPNFKSTSTEDVVDNPSLSSNNNFIDKYYFGESNVSKNQNLHHVENSFQNTEFLKLPSSKSNYQNLATESIEKSKTPLFNSNESQESILKNKHIKDAFKSMYKSNVSINESFEQSDVINSDRDMNMIKSDSKIFKLDNELNTYSVEKSNLFSKQNHLCENKRKTDQNSSIYSDLAKSNNPTLIEPSHGEKSISSKENKETVTTAYDFVSNLHKEQEVQSNNVTEVKNKFLEMKMDTKGFRILRDQVTDLSHFTRDEILSLLKQSILYQDDNLLVLNKPYSLVIHDSKTTKSPCLSSFLEDLAKEIDGSELNSKLVTVHRLDKETTGCLIIARNEATAQNLQSLFAQRKIIKKYWILTSKVPDPSEGLIDIPIAEGSINNKKRMVLHPEIPNDLAYKNHSRKGKPALTSYKVLSESGNAALVEVTPITGVKHQVRVHFGFGLSCPIIGDHKYSHFDKLAPQKLPSDILQRLHVRQSKVRYIPMHIHAKSVTVPGYFEDRDLYVQAPLPNHLKENLKKLKFKKK